MHHTDQIERWRNQTTSPYDRLRTELARTPKWRFIKRKHLTSKVAAITESLTLLFQLDK
jgi:hypothetical protein